MKKKIIFMCFLIVFVVLVLFTSSSDGLGLIRTLKPAIKDGRSSDIKSSSSNNEFQIDKLGLKNADVFVDKFLKKSFKNPFSVYETTNEDQGLTFFKDEYETDDKIIATQFGKYVVLTPKGYEELGPSHVFDQMNCDNLLSTLYGIEFPYDKMILKLYIKSDNYPVSAPKGGWAFQNATFHASTKGILDMYLQSMKENDPAWFLYNSSPEYCADAHELTHSFFDKAHYLPLWMDEGLANYSQKIVQKWDKEVKCVENGFYGSSAWSDFQDKFYSFSDLSEKYSGNEEAVGQWYNTSMCFVIELVSDYGEENFKKVIQEINKYPENHSSEDLDNYWMVKKVLVPVLGDGIYAMLEKYGIKEEDCQPAKPEVFD